MVNGHRKLYALDTYDREEATARMAELVAGKGGATGPVSGNRYLKNLVRLGEWAKDQIGQGSGPGGDLLIGEAFEAYELSRRRPMSGPRTMKEYRTRWRMFAEWAAKNGLKKIRDVGTDTADAYVRYLETPGTYKGKAVARSASTVDTHIQFLRLLYRVLDPAWPNPFDGVRSGLTAASTPYRRLSVAEVRKLHETAEGDYKRLILIGYTTGMRLVDAATLKWSDVRIRERTLSVSPRKTRRRKGGKTLTVPLINPLLKDLKKTPPEQRKGYVLPAVGPTYDSQQRKTRVNKTLTALFAEAGVKSDARGKASFHSLRVTWQSLNDDAGTNRAIARSVLGHTDARMSDTYSRVDIEVARKAVDGAIPKW